VDSGCTFCAFHKYFVIYIKAKMTAVQLQVFCRFDRRGLIKKNKICSDAVSGLINVV